MSFPAGPLPNATQLPQAWTDTPNHQLAFAGGGSDVDLTDPTVWKGAPCAYEVVITVAGTLIAQLAGDAAPVTYAATVVGQSIRGAFVLLKGSSTCSCVARR